MRHQDIPVIATGSVYADFIAAASRNIQNGLRLAQNLRDAEATKEWQTILDTFVDASSDLECLIADANAPGEYEPGACRADYLYDTRRDALDARK